MPRCLLAPVLALLTYVITQGVPGLYPTCTLVNNNARTPAQPVYPKKSPSDAPYDVTEAKLRSAIFIPPGFTYGKKKPTLFIPGTGK